MELHRAIGAQLVPSRSLEVGGFSSRENQFFTGNLVGNLSTHKGLKKRLNIAVIRPINSIPANVSFNTPRCLGKVSDKVSASGRVITA